MERRFNIGPTPRRRLAYNRTNRIIPQTNPDKHEGFIFLGKNGLFEGYFKINYNPDEQYDHMHLCAEWGECCSKNFALKPTHLIAAEQDKKNPIHKKKVKSLEKEMKSIKKIIIKNLLDEYENPRQPETIIALMKTYSWLCNELLRVKY